ncbi:X-ray radiation resistance-associated protein 1 isoform X2 [Sceloporus undulatus]|uniref:X-ray radiation resistance-associated protein 1 isoform X2 n=1 Tax=Sceloporus undulatus TaxID=8520 RepID=UPI001C4ABC7C|nr:X-ray radiation resistance-associated protein 1 isoform X2 [Sceloporus undulatus]
MATKGIYKLDDGNCYPTNCFPARNLLRPRYDEGVGHWQVARQTAEQTKIELLLGKRPTRITWEGAVVPTGDLRHLDEKTLDGAQLIAIHHVKSPSDLCAVDVSGRNFSSAKEEDFEQFTSVAYISATENLLTLDVFRKFPQVRELELSLNGLRSLKVNAGDFPHLEILDLSYNNLSPEDVQVLGVLSHLKVLHLTANGLNSLPLDLAVSESEGCQRFPALEVLLLDDNYLSHPNVFVSLANLQKLKQLNLDRNGIKEVPYLHHVGNSCFSIHPLSAKSGIREGLRSRRNAGKRFRQDGPLKRSEMPEYIVLQNSKDPDRTEVVFPFWTPEPSIQEPSPSPYPDPKVSSVNDDPEFTLPLSELRFLSLANNQIEHEEDLLAVALFPSLTELTFYGNPFTTSRSGDPPLLTSFLQNKLGIKLVRKKIPKLEKPRLFIPVKANRKVKSQLPKVRKRSPKIDSLLETTFWQLWTGADLDPHKLSLGLSQPLPSIKSLEYDPNRPILLTLAPEERSAPYSLTSSFTDDDLSALQSSANQIQSGSISGPLSSLDNMLFPPSSEAQSSPEQGQPRPLSLHGSLLEKGDLGDLPPGEDQPESGPSIEKDVSESTPPTLARQDQMEPILPPPLPPQEQDLSETVPTSLLCMAEDALSATPSPLTCEEEQLPMVPPPNSPLPAESLSKPTPLMEPPAEEQGMSESPPPVASLSVEEDLPKAFPPSGPPMLEDDQLESILPAISSLKQLDWLECVSPSGSLTGDLSGTLLPGAAPVGDEQIEPYPSQSSLSPAEDLLELDSLINLLTEEPDLAKLFPPTGSALEEKDQPESVPLPSSFLEEQKFLEPVPPSGSLGGEENLVGSLLPAVEHDLSKEQDLSASQNINQEPEPQMSRISVPQAEDFQPSAPSQLQKISSDFLLASRSSSRELYRLFAEARLEAMPIGLSDEYPSDIFSIDEEFLKEEKADHFFMTQVDEESSSHLQLSEQPREGKTRKPWIVPEKYQGYEELLGGDPGPDFVEPVANPLFQMAAVQGMEVNSGGDRGARG